jgi:hypothetical protein
VAIFEFAFSWEIFITAIFGNSFVEIPNGQLCFPFKSHSSAMHPGKVAIFAKFLDSLPLTWLFAPWLDCYGAFSSESQGHLVPW